MKKSILLLALTLMVSCEHTQMAQRPKNVVMVIVDGMGPEQVHAGRIFMGNQKLSFEQFPVQGTVSTHNIDGDVTDSAAAATAIATGQKAKNQVVSPGKTMLEYFKEQGKSVGIATNTLLTDATPAAFAAHAETRKDSRDILGDYMHQTQPNFVAGADEPHYLNELQKSSASYKIINKASELKNTQGYNHVYAGFGVHSMIPERFVRKTAMPLSITRDEYYAVQDIPRPSDVARAAVDFLSQNPKGFFLMIESGLVDWIGHKNKDMDDTPNSPRAIEALGHEMAETSKMVDVIRDFASKNPDTLVVVTADHETGGLQIDESKTRCIGQAGCVASAQWTSDLYEEYTERMSKHTGVNVGVYAMGPGSENFAGPMDNTLFMAKILGK